MIRGIERGVIVGLCVFMVIERNVETYYFVWFFLLYIKIWVELNYFYGEICLNLFFCGLFLFRKYVF